MSLEDKGISNLDACASEYFSRRGLKGEASERQYDSSVFVASILKVVGFVKISNGFDPNMHFNK